MKPGSLLLNTARGGLVDEGALCTALAEKHLAGAGLDVFSSEPPGHHPLLEYENVITTAHIGGHSEDAILGMGRAAIKGLINA
jgi:D-3-phosphoglycerate dehydrogenase